jgi:hypothetical protein
LRIEIKRYLYYNAVMEYKVVETSTVTDEEIEKVLNHWTVQGYAFESVHFVTTESSAGRRWHLCSSRKKERWSTLPRVSIERGEKLRAEFRGFLNSMTPLL